MTTPPTPRRIDVERLRDLASKATPGPWVAGEPNRYGDINVSWPGDGSAKSSCGYSSWQAFATCYGSEDGFDSVMAEGAANAAFIAAANPATVLALLAELEHGRGMIEAVRRYLNMLCKIDEPWPGHLQGRVDAYDRAIAGDTP